MTTRTPTSTNLTDLLLQNLADLPAPSPPPPHLEPPPTNPNLTPAKPTLLTLHALYPTTLLPALDLLDRRLITRLDLLPPPPPSSSSPPPPPAAAAATTPLRSTYHVRSAAPPQRQRRRRKPRPEALPPHSYEVRTTAWSCTCAAFAFGAFHHHHRDQGGRASGGDDDDDDPFTTGGGAAEDGMMMDDGDGGQRDDGAEPGDDGKGWGGLMRGYEGGGRGKGKGKGGWPVCKHLLACVVAEWWDVARQMVEVRQVERGEVAGWAAGWGG